MTAFSLQFILLAMLYMNCLVGFTVNMIMVVANLLKWKSMHSLPTCDKILCSLAIFRALDFLNIALRNSIFQLLPWLMKNNMARSILYILTVFSFFNNQWIVTLLCVFYCVKIVTYNYKLFIFLKTRISTMVPQLILFTLLISLISSLPLGWFGHKLELQNVFNGSNETMAQYESATGPNFNHQFLIFAVGSFPPFLIFCVAISVLICFLLIHTRRMRSNESHIQSPNLKSHFDALKSMGLFLLLQIMYFICMSLFSFGIFFTRIFKSLISSIILCTHPLVHSLYVISISGEVRKMFISMCLGVTRSL